MDFHSADAFESLEAAALPTAMHTFTCNHLADTFIQSNLYLKGPYEIHYLTRKHYKWTGEAVD